MLDVRPRKTGRRWSVLKKLSGEELGARTAARNKTFNMIRKTRRKSDPVYDQRLKDSANSWRRGALKSLSGWARLQSSRHPSLTAEYLISIYPADGLCPYLLLPLTRGGVGNNPLTASLDCINPALRYIEGNVRIISRRANMIKNDCVDPEVFRRIADQLERDLCAQYR
jgi:hypothetical protein